MTALRVDLGTVSFNTGPDADGVSWHIERDGLEGWDSPDVNAEDTPVTGHHGQAALWALYGGRPLIARGWVEAPTAPKLWAAHARLSSLVPLASPVPLTVYETAPKTLAVVQRGKPLIRLGAGPTRLQFSLSVKALTPFKRGASQTVTLAAGASTTITYAGTWPGAPTITTTGAGTVDIANTTTSTHVATTIAAPTGTEIVCAEPGHTVYSGTTNLYSRLVQPVSWLSLAVGANTLTNSGTAPVTLTYHDLYL